MEQNHNMLRGISENGGIVFYGVDSTEIVCEMERLHKTSAVTTAAQMCIRDRVLTDSTKKNLQMRVDAECGACAGKMDLAKKAKELNLDAIHDTVHEMAKDEARHGRGMQGLLDRYFK